jgi:competence protein ComEA
MERRFRERFLGGAASTVQRLIGSRFAKPVGQAALAVSGLLILAIVGRTAVAGNGAASLPHLDEPPQASAAATAPQLGAAPVVSTTLVSEPAPAALAPGAAAARTTASAEAPVFLNTAGEADLRRLPGIGAKRADAILALRARLGRFRAVEDLLKVRGIGRATLKRLRPLIRLDAPPADAGSPPPATPP